jgi:hypothetical protein
MKVRTARAAAIAATVGLFAIVGSVALVGVSLAASGAFAQPAAL